MYHLQRPPTQDRTVIKPTTEDEIVSLTIKRKDANHEWREPPQGA